MAAVLDPLVGSCITKLQEIIVENAVLILGVKEDLKELQGTIKQIQCFLYDAEQRMIQESAVQNWISELRDAMYDADDIVDSARFEGSKLLRDHTSSSRKSTPCWDISFLSCFPGIQRRHEIAVKIRDLNKRIEKLSKHGNSFLHPGVAPSGQGSISKQKLNSKLAQHNLVGKEIIHSSRKLVELVLAHKEHKAYKLAVVGTGGVGKTTLAQKIYNDQKIKGMEGGEDGSVEIQKGEAPSRRMLFLPRLKRLELAGCPKLGSLPRQLGQEATSLKVLDIRRASCLKVVEDLPFLSELLLIQGCDSLERISNLPQVGTLRVNRCPGLWCVEGLGNLQQLFLSKGMKKLSSLWVPGLQQQHNQLHGEDLDVYDWK